MVLKSFLRYNTRHCVWFPRGYKDKVLPQLNPISSCSHGKGNKRTWYLHEPGWLFRLRQRVFAYAGAHRCGGRGESVQGMHDKRQLPDTWNIGPDGNRTCSYCGSIHFDDLMKICRLSQTDERYSVDGTDKSYKVYVRQPGVRNASEGAIKFYKAHSPENPTPEQEQLFSSAVRRSHQRFMDRYYPKQKGSAA